MWCQWFPHLARQYEKQVSKYNLQKHTMVRQRLIWSARREALCEGLLEVADFEVMTESIMTGTHSKIWRERVPDLGAAMLKLRAPNEVRTNGAENKLVFESRRERVEWLVCKTDCKTMCPFCTLPTNNHCNLMLCIAQKWCHPQNPKYTTYCNTAWAMALGTKNNPFNGPLILYSGRPEHRQHATIGEVQTCGSWTYAHEQTDKHNTQDRRAHYNTPLP